MWASASSCAPRLGWRWVKRGGGRRPRHSQGVPSQNHALEFMGARGSVPSPFGLFLLFLAFLWDLLPVLGDREESRQVRCKAGLDPEPWAACRAASWCAYAYLHTSPYTLPALHGFPCHTAENCLHSSGRRKEAIKDNGRDVCPARALCLQLPWVNCCLLPCHRGCSGKQGCSKRCNIMHYSAADTH